MSFVLLTSIASSSTNSSSSNGNVLGEGGVLSKVTFNDLQFHCFSFVKYDVSFTIGISRETPLRKTLVSNLVRIFDCLSRLDTPYVGSRIRLIMEYLVNISKRRAFRSLNEDILKITILKTNTLKISNVVPTLRHPQYAVSNPLDTPYRTTKVNFQRRKRAEEVLQRIPIHRRQRVKMQQGQYPTWVSTWLMLRVCGFLYLEIEVVCVEFGCYFEVELECEQYVWFLPPRGFTLILATLDGLDVGLLGDVIGGGDCDDDE
ncbi:hypothetical protein Tco_0015515 [Tanacetum coccineum]